MLGALSAVAAAATLDEIRDDRGPEAAATELARIVSDTPPKKLDKALAPFALDAFELDVAAVLGAELIWHEVSPVTHCRWQNGLTCTLALPGDASLDPSAYELRCASPYGATAPMTVEAEATPDGPRWTLTRVERCLMFGESVQIAPKASDALEGVGAGTEYIPPELTGLTWDQVREELTEALPTFQACTRRRELVITGRIEVAFHIGPDGRFDRLEPVTDTLGDPAVTACILERFSRVRLPPPMDGFTEGRWPLQFQ